MITFLYKLGNECKDITGGFISCPYALAGTSVNVIKNSDNMQLSPNGISKYTTLSHNNAIDLTEYKRIYFDIEVPSTLGGNQWVRLGLSTTNNSNDYGVGEVSVKNQIGRKLYYIDLDNKSGLAFVKAHINSGANAISPFTSMKIYNIWLEKTIEKIPISSNLAKSVEYVENIKNEVYSLRIKLINNLINKGVECSVSDKLTELISKVDGITLESLGGKKWAKGKFESSNITVNLEFTPNIVICFYMQDSWYHGVSLTIRTSDYYNSDFGYRAYRANSYSPLLTSSFIEIEEKSFSTSENGAFNTNYNWIAIE